jgi:hypothetical protein
MHGLMREGRVKPALYSTRNLALAQKRTLYSGTTDCLYSPGNRVYFYSAIPGFVAGIIQKEEFKL